MRSQVPLFDVPYSFRAAAESRAFAQFPLISADEFGRHAKARDIDLGFGTGLYERLERLDRLGALCPILFEAGPRGGINEGVVPAQPTYRDEGHFVEWSRLSPAESEDPADPAPRARARYGRWQLLYAWDAIDLGAVRVDLDALLEPGGFVPEGDVEAWLRGQRDTHRSLDAQWRGTLKLLIRLQGRFAPSIKGRMGHLSSTMVWDPEAGEMVDPWPEERRGFDAGVVLKELGLSLEQLEDLHRALALRASWEDPLSPWHPLSRMAPFSQREKLKGAALRAQDGYDAADVVRGFYFLLTSELLPEADEFTEPRGAGWRRQLLGEDWPTLRLRHKHLVAQLRRLSLWPLQVHLVVEGESEAVAAREIFREFLGEDDLEASGISITNLEGIGNLQHQKAVFSLAKAAVSWTLLICDQEGDAARDARQLQAAGLLDPETTVLWNRNFEEDNFTDEEIVAEFCAMGRERGVSLPFEAEISRAAYEERKSRQTGRTGGFVDYLVKEAANPRVGPVAVTKPQLAQRLAARMLDNLGRLGEEVALEKHPFLAHMVGVLRVT